MLNETQHHEKLQTIPPPPKIIKNLSSLNKTHKKELTTKETDYLTNFKYEPSLFYSLPKIHKS